MRDDIGAKIQRRPGANSYGIQGHKEAFPAEGIASAKALWRNVLDVFRSRQGPVWLEESEGGKNGRKEGQR